MKPDIDKKFDSLRNAPTELSRQQVESIIKGLPNIPVTPMDTTSWTSWFSLNNLLIVAFAGTVAAGMLLWNKIPEDAGVLTTIEPQVESGITENLPTIIDAEPEKIEAITKEVKEQPTKDETLTTANVDLKPAAPTQVIEQPVEEKKKEVANSPTPSFALTKPTIEPDITKIQTQKATEIKPRVKKADVPITQFNKSTTMVFQKPISFDPNAIPDLTNGEMRRLKKKLFENLMDDKLIINKWKAIEIDLPGDEIIVNGKVIDQDLFVKYNTITEKVGWGPDRKIKFDEEYIKVGDFTATGFRGSGFGTFRTVPGKKRLPDESINRESLVLKKEREIKKEQRELDAFSQTLLDTSVGRRGRKNVLSVNLKQEKCKKLHKELYELLLEGGLIETKKDYVLVEISKKSIHINVLELNEVLYEKYSDLFDSYRIKSGPRRQIRMSEHTIRVGDFSRGSFTGTTLILTE